MEKNMFFGARKTTFQQAEDLRNNMTNAENLLWEYLRLKPLGHKFRRQHPIDIFIADFYCHSLKLIIEVDGKIHLNKDVRVNDKSRQEYLESEEIVFLRFKNEEVEYQFVNVVKQIESYIKTREKPL